MIEIGRAATSQEALDERYDPYALHTFQCVDCGTVFYMVPPKGVRMQDIVPTCEQCALNLLIIQDGIDRIGQFMPCHTLHAMTHREALGLYEGQQKAVVPRFNGNLASFDWLMAPAPEPDPEPAPTSEVLHIDAQKVGIILAKA